MRLSVWMAITTSLVVICAALVILSTTTLMVRDRLEADVSARLKAQLDQQVALLLVRLDDVAADVQAVAKGPILQDWLDSGPQGSFSRQPWQVKLEAQLSSIVATHRNYFQLRILDLAGREQAKAVRREGRIIVVAEDRFQDQSDRPFVPPMMALSPDQTFFSMLDLNREHGTIEYPLQPTLRIAAAIFDRLGRRQGGVIVDLNADELLPPRELDSIRFLVADRHGAFLQHPDPSKEFGLEIGSGVTLRSDHREAAQRLEGRDFGIESLSFGLTSPAPELIAFERLPYGPKESGNYWVVIAAEPQAVAFAPVDSLGQKLAAVIFLISVLACVIGWFLAHRVTKPLQHITRIARQISAGNLEAEAKVEGGGEVAELGTAFNIMTRRLRQMIHDERMARHDLSRANQELQRSNEELGDFAHAASHDLRTPLRALRALPEWIQEDLMDAEVPPTVRDHLAKMKAQAERMDQVIDSLMKYARVGKLETRVIAFDPKEAVLRVLELVAPPPDFNVEVDFEMARIVTSLVAFEQVVRNLVQNAISHHDRDEGRIQVCGRWRDDILLLEVSDDGPGIPPEYHERVLLPFQSLKPRDKGGGSGLGLALVNRIVLHHGGRIEILSKAGVRGTTFRVTWPMTQPEQQEPDLHGSGEALSGRPMTAA